MLLLASTSTPTDGPRYDMARTSIRLSALEPGVRQGAKWASVLPVCGQGRARQGEGWRRPGGDPTQTQTQGARWRRTDGLRLHNVAPAIQQQMDREEARVKLRPVGQRRLRRAGGSVLGLALRRRRPARRHPILVAQVAGAVLRDGPQARRRGEVLRALVRKEDQQDLGRSGAAPQGLCQPGLDLPQAGSSGARAPGGGSAPRGRSCRRRASAGASPSPPGCSTGSRCPTRCPAPAGGALASGAGPGRAGGGRGRALTRGQRPSRREK